MIFKLRFNKNIFFLVIVYLLVCCLRLYQVSFFEFKNDQLRAIQMGNATRQVNFLITHGMGSGVAVNNPPFFLWLMGLVTFFTQDPLYIAILFTLLNLCALFLALLYFYKTLPKTYAILASVILAFSPAFTMYSGIIWAQCLLPIIIILLHAYLFKFIKERRRGVYFVLAAILVAVASQLHLSGFFLFPLLIIIAIYYKSEIKIKTLISTLLSVFLIFLPYLYHLIFEGELNRLLSYGKFLHRSIYWKVFREHLRLASFDFFRYYFRYDFNAVLNKSAGISWFILYPLSCILIALFAIGFFIYVIWLIRGRKLFNTDITELNKYPLPYQLAGAMTLAVTLGYLIFRVQTPLHYFIILFPCYSLISAYAAYKVWHYYWGRVVISLAIASTIVLLIGTFLFLKSSGGHPYEYGPSYLSLLKWKEEIYAMLKKEERPVLTVQFLGKGKSDTETVAAVIEANNKCNPDIHSVPVRLTIGWNTNLMRYEHWLEIERKP